MDTNISELLKNSANINVTMKLEDLKTILHNAIDYQKSELQELIKKDKEETYKTIEQVSEMLSVDKSTLWRWKTRKYLVPIEVGGKRLYKYSEIVALMNGGRS